MKRAASIAFIVLYLGVLGYGLVSHTLVYNVAAHPGMYYIVWDMYCGWTAYESRLHLVAEGESGKFYELTPPWGSFRPFGSNDRRHYDGSAVHAGQIARNILDHTDHEPMVRILAIEEAWSKKYNTPPELWARFYDEPFERVSYFRPRARYSLDGTCLERYLDFGGQLAHDALMSNPRLKQEMSRGRSFIAIDPQSAGYGVVPAGGTRQRR